MTQLPEPRRVAAPYDWMRLLLLLREAFAYMDGRIDPPSSVHRLSAGDIARQAGQGEIWVLEEAGLPVACIFLTPYPDRLYLGKLAVAQGYRGRGAARLLVETAYDRARALGLPCLELQTRVELTGNHAAFAAMGFAKTGETAHEGFDRPTSVTMRRPVKADR